MRISRPLSGWLGSDPDTDGAPLENIVVQIGNRSERLSKHYSEADLPNMSCARKCLGVGNESAISAYLDQSGAALSLLERVARSEVSSFYSMGLISNSASEVTYNLVGAYSVASKDGSEQRAAAAARLASDMDALLEASSGQQLADTSRARSAVSMLADSPRDSARWGISHKYVLVTPANLASYLGENPGDPYGAALLSASIAQGNSVFLGGTGEIQIGSNRFASTIGFYEKGGGAALKIDAIVPQDNLKQNGLALIK
jgi:hypothetical protein